MESRWAEAKRIAKILIFFVFLPLFLAPSCKPPWDKNRNSGNSGPTLPAPPSTFTATVVSTTQINLAWTGVPSGVTSLVIQESTDGGNTWTTLTTIPASQTSFSATGLSPATQYSFRIGSVTGSTAGPWSPVIRANTIVISSLSTTGAPPTARMGHSMIFDPNVGMPTNPRLVVFGGLAAGTPPAVTDELWILDLTTNAWSKIPKPVIPPGIWPPARMNHSAILDTTNNRMIVFGGYDGTPGDEANDLWSLDLSSLTWTFMTISGGSIPNAREGHNAIFDQNPGPRMIMFGGVDPVQSYNDVWEATLPPPPSSSNPTVWTNLTPSPPAPPLGPAGRTEHASVFSAAASGALVSFGGYDPVLPAGPFNDAWSFSLGSTPAWSAVSFSGGPSARFGHSSILRGSSLMIFGGSTGGTALSEMWQLNLGTPNTWNTVILPPAPPPARLQHSAAFDPATSTMYIFGGGAVVGTPSLNDVWQFGM